MIAPTEDPATNANLIKINWIDMADILDTGRDVIKYYRIYWDDGYGGPFYESFTTPLNTFVTTFTWGHDKNIRNGTTYKFKVRP